MVLSCFRHKPVDEDFGRYCRHRGLSWWPAPLYHRFSQASFPLLLGRAGDEHLEKGRRYARLSIGMCASVVYAIAS